MNIKEIEAFLCTTEIQLSGLKDFFPAMLIDISERGQDKAEAQTI